MISKIKLSNIDIISQSMTRKLYLFTKVPIKLSCYYNYGVSYLFIFSLILSLYVGHEHFYNRQDGFISVYGKLFDHDN